MSQFYAYDEFLGAGSTVFTITFDTLLNADNLTVQVDGVDAPYSYDYVTNRVTLSAIAPSGSVVTIRRTTPTTPVVVFEQGSTYRQSDDLNTLLLQYQYIHEEVADSTNIALRSILVAIADLPEKYGPGDDAILNSVTIDTFLKLNYEGTSGGITQDGFIQVKDSNDDDVFLLTGTPD